MILLLHVGDDIENGVDVVRGGCHSEAGSGGGGTAKEEVVLGHRHVQVLEHKRYGWDCNRYCVACVESS